MTAKGTNAPTNTNPSISRENAKEALLAPNNPSPRRVMIPDNAPCVTIHYEGIPNKRTGIVRETLAKVRILLRHVRNIQFVSKNICEFLVTESYAERFKVRMKEEFGLDSLSNFDPNKLPPNVEGTNDENELYFRILRRLHANTSEKRSPQARQYFSTILVSIINEKPELQQILDQIAVGDTNMVDG